MSTIIDALMPGERVTYYRGSNLARTHLTTQIEPADAIWQLALAGEVDLAQRRRGQMARSITSRRGGALSIERLSSRPPSRRAIGDRLPDPQKDRAPAGPV